MMHKLGSFFFVFFFLTTTVFAISDDFRIQFSLIENDTTPPTTPLNLAATSIDSAQIDVTWNASTDNVLLSGYQVFRNAMQIATTTLTMYSDTGLTPSTTYAYYVRAFDSSFNISTSSNVATVTTQFLPSQKSGGGSRNKIEIVSLEIEPYTHEVKMRWETSERSRYELRWGRTGSYELGFVTSEVFNRDHQTIVANLEPGTIYEYELLVYNREGDIETFSRSRFKTLDAEDVLPPTNVSSLNSEVYGEDVKLTWKNSEDDDFSHVRIVRSYLFYPSDPSDGYVVYQGDGTSVLDEGALTQGVVQYYTVFSYDIFGNVSSGAVIYVSPAQEAFIEDVVPDNPLFDIDIADVVLVQNGEHIKAVDKSFTIDTSKSFTVRIAYSLLPEHLKAIHVNFTHPVDSSLSFSFLLRVNKDKTAYEATVAPLSIPGSFPITFSIYDFSTQKLFEFEGEIFSQIQETAPVYVLSVKSSGVTKTAWGMFLLTLCILWLFVIKRRKRYRSIS